MSKIEKGATWVGLEIIGKIAAVLDSRAGRIAVIAGAALATPMTRRFRNPHTPDRLVAVQLPCP